MSKDIVMYAWNVRVLGYLNVGYKAGEKQIETTVQVMARNKRDAKNLAMQEACNTNASFIFARTKVRGKDIKKVA